MEKYKNVFKTEKDEQSGLTLRLAYMVEDFMELIKRGEKEDLITEES